MEIKTPKQCVPSFFLISSFVFQIFDYAELKGVDGRQILFVIMEHGEKDLAHILKEYAPGNGSTKNELTDVKTKFYWEEMLEAVQVAHQVIILTILFLGV